jgi:hypothetical protein
LSSLCKQPDFEIENSSQLESVRVSFGAVDGI